jgi:pimeloyl-ACP methyl ester carboxylesterase
MSDEMFKYTYRFLIQNGFRAIGITLRGFGESDSSSTYNIDIHAADIDFIIKTLQLDDVVLAGYSFGGVIAAYYAAKYKSPLIKKLLLVSANVPKYTRDVDFPHGPMPEDINNLIAFTETDLATMLNVYGPVFQLTEEEMPLKTGNWLNNINLQTTQKAMTEGIKLLRDTDLRPLLNKIDIPTTIFHAKDDAMVAFSIAEQAHAGLKDSRLVVFPEGGHWFVFVNQDYFHRELLNLLNA